MRIVFSPQARLDMAELHAYIARRAAAQAALTLARIRKAINRLDLFSA
jgi:plasmid stabilization system protein ParE